MQHEVDAQSMSDVTILRELSTYLLPKDNPEFRWRIGTAMSLLVVSKLINVSVSRRPNFQGPSDTVLLLWHHKYPGPSPKRCLDITLQKLKIDADELHCGVFRS